MENLIAVACGLCGDVRSCEHAPDWCRACKARHDRRPRALIRTRVVVIGTTIRVQPLAEFFGEWAPAAVEAILRASGAEVVQAPHRRNGGEL